MKLKAILFLAGCALALHIAFVQHNTLLAWAMLFVLSAALSPARVTARLMNPTLVVPILTGTIFDVIRTKIVEMGYISTDFGKTSSGFAAPVKWDQEIISQMPIDPPVEDHTPGDDLTADGATNAKTLLYDVRVKINRAKRVRIKLPNLDAVSLMANPAFMKGVENAGVKLARAVLSDVFGAFNSQNFSQELVVASGSQDFDTLGDATEKLNTLGTNTPRFMLTGSNYIRPIAGDPRTQSGDYKGQMLAGDPYRRLNGIEGFEEVREFPLMPTNNVSLGDIVGNVNDYISLTAGTLSDAAYPKVANGDRLRFDGDDLPAGLLEDHDYYVRDLDVDNDKFKVADDVGGAAINITDAGTGTMTAQKFEALNAVAFNRTAIHFASRQLEDNVALAQQMGVPLLFKEVTEPDPEGSGLTLTVFFHLSTKKELFAVIYITYGFNAGRGMACDTNNPVAAALTAGKGMDYQALRIVETATN